MAFCPGCGAEVVEGARFCPACGRSLKREQVTGAADKGVEMQPKYTAMWYSIWIMKVVGWLLMIVGSIYSIIIGADIAGDPEYATGEGVAVIIMGVIGSILYGIIMLGVADLFHKVKNI